VRTRSLPAVATAALSIAVASQAAVGAVTFQNIASVGQTVPGTFGSETFTNFGLAPAIQNGQVVFEGFGQYRTGFYSKTPGNPVSTVVDTSNASAPAGYPFFYLFRTSDNYESAPSLYNGTLAFTGQPYNGPFGVYTATAPATADVSNVSSSGRFGDAVLTGQGLFYVGGPSGNTALYHYGPSTHALTTRYDTSSVATNGGTISDFNGPSGPTDFSASASVVAFSANGGTSVFTDAPGPLTRLAAQNDPLPGNPSFHQWVFNAVDVDASTGTVAYATIGAFYGQGAAIVEMRTGSPTRVALTNDLLGYAGANAYVEGISLDGGHIAFAVRNIDDYRLYTDVGGTLQEILRSGDTLDGHTVAGIYMGNQGLDGNQLAFTVEFNEPSSAGGLTRAEYVATVPEPVGLGATLLATPLLLLTRRQRHRSL
jgi:hypothetical protein